MMSNNPNDFGEEFTKTVAILLVALIGIVSLTMLFLTMIHYRQ